MLKSSRMWMVLFVFAAALLWMALPSPEAATLPSTGLMGIVKSSDGKILEGVAVTARANDKSFSTSVYTDKEGQYYFPTLADGRYKVWAQAVGFDAARGETSIAANRKIVQNFSLKPLKEFHMQLSGTEWANSMPADTPGDARMRDVVHNNCTSCHLTGYVLSKRFDSTGWGIILNTMLETQTQPDQPNRKLITSYKEDLVGYLTKIRGPQPLPWKWKPMARPAGEAAEVIVTEYDVPRGESPDYVMSHNGTDWAEGIAGRYEVEVMHDASIGTDGKVYFTDNSTPERTVGQLDPKTGKVTGFKLADKDGNAVRTHGSFADPKGYIWLTNGTESSMLRFDPRTSEFKRFPKPKTDTPAPGVGMGGAGGIGGMIAVDSKGNAWTPSGIGGAYRLNPETGEYTEFKAVTSRGNPYGLAIDAEDGAWFTQMGADVIGHVTRDGKVSEVVLPPAMEGVSEKDKEIGQRSGAITNAAPLYQRGPRRIGADRNGDSVYVAEYWTGVLTKINIHTNKTTSYKMAERYSHPYSIMVDKNHMVWICLLNSDRIAKFDPNTEKFTEYPLPTLGTNIRYIDVDNTTQQPEVWVPYTGSNKLARIQFRTSASAAPVARSGY